jgi:thiamine phosphate synthase YjbQ (UPF0047 family)
VKSATTTIDVSAPERYAYLDLTDDLRRAIKDSGVTDGAVVAFCAHTTCALLINEWEDGAMEDFRARIRALVPDDDGHYYAHDDLDRRTRPLAREGDAPLRDVARHPRLGGRARVRAVAATDPVRDGRAEGPAGRLPRVRRVTRMGD